MQSEATHAQDAARLAQAALERERSALRATTDAARSDVSTRLEEHVTTLARLNDELTERDAEMFHVKAAAAEQSRALKKEAADAELARAALAATVVELQGALDRERDALAPVTARAVAAEAAAAAADAKATAVGDEYAAATAAWAAKEGAWEGRCAAAQKDVARLEAELRGLAAEAGPQLAALQVRRALFTTPI